MRSHLYVLFFFITSTVAASTVTSGKRTSATTPFSTTEWIKIAKSTTRSLIFTTTPQEPNSTRSESQYKAKNVDGLSPSVPNRTDVFASSFDKKLDYQINQTQFLTSLVQDNHLALRRLIDMFSYFMDNNPRASTNDTTYSYQDHQRINIIGDRHQAVHTDNHTLHVSFGTDADPDRYPWTVALRGNDRDRCGGTLIDDQHVLTAAHCIGGRTTTVFLGSHLYNAGEEVKTSFYCVHHAYSSSNYYRNDLAIIRLAKPVSVRPPRRVGTIELCNGSLASNLVNLWMVGWGLKNNEIEPDELQEAPVNVADRSMCTGSSRYTDICVQSRSSSSPMGACTGDSGSGLFHHSIANNRWCLIGVASSSNTDICEQTQFSTYVQASSPDYTQWFQSVLDRKKTLEELQKLEKCKPRTWGQEFCRWYAC